MTGYTQVHLNPDGTMPFGLVVIVHAETGVLYGHQCGGYGPSVRTVEGFLVPLSSDQRACQDEKALQSDYHEQALISIFATFCGHLPSSGDDWAAELLDLLEDSVADVLMWKTSQDDVDTCRTALQLDRSRLFELTEGWIPVITPYGPGTLLV